MAVRIRVTSFIPPEYRAGSVIGESCRRLYRLVLPTGHSSTRGSWSERGRTSVNHVSIETVARREHPQHRRQSFRKRAKSRFPTEVLCHKAVAYSDGGAYGGYQRESQEKASQPHWHVAHSP